MPDAVQSTDAPIDLTGLDATKIPGMSDLNANVASAEHGMDEASQNLDAQIADVPTPPPVQGFDQPTPQRNLGPLMAMSPWLIALAAIGGARTKLSANNMLASTTGMINGLQAGDDQRYQEAYEKYQQQQKEFADIQKQKWDVYKEMVKVYKDQIDGKHKALQIAESAVRDSKKDRASAMLEYQQSVRAALALNEERRKWDNMHQQWMEFQQMMAQKKATEDDRRKAEHDREKDKAAKADKGKATVADVNDDIDALLKTLDSTRKDTLGVTGVTGKVRRGVETAENMTHLSDDTTASTFASKLAELQLKVAPLLATGRTAKDQREKIDTIIRGAQAGDTRQKTKAALLALKKELSKIKDQPDRTVVRTGTLGGKKVVQYSDGTTEYAN